MKLYGDIKINGYLEMVGVERKDQNRENLSEMMNIFI